MGAVVIVLLCTLGQPVKCGTLYLNTPTIDPQKCMRQDPAIFESVVTFLGTRLESSIKSIKCTVPV